MKKLRFLCFMLTFFLTANIGFERKANAVAAVAPAAAIGALEAAALLVIAAAAIGMISQSTSRRYQSSIDHSIDKIKTLTGEALEYALSEASSLLTQISVMVPAVGVSAVCGSMIHRRIANSSSCSNGPDSCCEDFFQRNAGKFERRGGGGGIKFFSNSKKNKVTCCMEWDHKSGGFEVFDKRGNHMGERGCDDQNDDPCAYTASRGQHALPASHNHRPRTAACTP